MALILKKQSFFRNITAGGEPEYPPFYLGLMGYSTSVGNTLFTIPLNVQSKNLSFEAVFASIRKFIPPAAGNVGSCVFSMRFDVANISNYIGFYDRFNSNNERYCRSLTSYKSVAGAVIDFEIHKIQMSLNEFILDGNVIATFSNNYTGVLNPVLYIGYTNSSGNMQGFKGQFFWAKAYADSALIRHLVPNPDRSGNLLDLVTGQQFSYQYTKPLFELPE